MLMSPPQERCSARICARRVRVNTRCNLTRTKDSGRGAARLAAHAAVAPGGLRRVERAVGTRDPRAVVVVLGPERGEADARRDAQRARLVERRGLDALPDALGDRLG